MSRYDLYTNGGRVVPCDDYKIEGNSIKYIEPYTHEVKRLPAGSIADIVEEHRNITPLGDLFAPKFKENRED